MIPNDAFYLVVNNLKQLPPSSIPPMLECLLATNDISPHDLFTQLLLLSSAVGLNDGNGNEELNSSEWISVVVALSHLLSKIDYAPNSLELFIWKCIIPMTKSPEMANCEIIDQVLGGSFLGIVKKDKFWNVLASTLIPYFLKVIGDSVDINENEEVDMFKWGSGINFLGPNLFNHNKKSEIDFSFLSGPFPLPTVCRVLSLILTTTSVHCAQEVSTLDKDCNLNTFLVNLLCDLCNMSERLLLKDVEQRHCAIKILIPNIFKSFSLCGLPEKIFVGSNQELSSGLFFRRLWKKCCKTLFCSGISERSDAYSLLSLYLFFNSSQKFGQPPTIDFEPLNDRIFWEEIKAGLRAEERLIRKQSLHILKSALHISSETMSQNEKTSKSSQTESPGPHAKSKRDLWADKEAKSLGISNFLLSNRITMNNSKRQWEAFVLLYEMLDEYGTHLLEAVWSHQINVLLECRDTPDNFVAKLGDKVFLPNENALEIFNWLSILWKIGFSHENPHVRCLIMKSFLSLDWGEHANLVKSVPYDFILGPLMNGLNDPVHHTDFGIKDVYTSTTIEAACTFFRHMSCYLDDSNRLNFIQNLASICRHSSLCRAGLMCLSECLASVACVSSNQIEVGTSVESLSGMNLCISVTNESMHVLDSLRYIIENCKHHFNPNYRMRVCEKVLEATRSIVCLHRVTDEAVFLFISAFPREFFNFDGSLRSITHQWLSSAKDKERIDTQNGEQTLLNRILEFPNKFTRESEYRNSFTDSDVNAWESEARRWARVLFIACENDFSPIATFITFYGNDNWSHSSKASLLKFCLIVSSLVIEVESTWQKGCKQELQDFLFPSLSELACACQLIMDKLMLYANSCSSIFWSSVVDVDTLSISYRGQLGGPSWRRLSPSTVPDVLNAITSFRTATSVIKLCTLLKIDFELHSCWIFLWGFFWKLVLSSSNDTESGAELFLGAYEALVDVLRVLACATSSDRFNITMNECIKKATCAPENVNLLDLLLKSFMKHINKLANLGVLTQARRAVLLHHKWLCLESLLSIIRCVVDTEMHLNVQANVLGETIRSCYSEIVESLDTTGDISVLAMLKSVKIILDLLSSRREVFGVVDPQIIWGLVRSSWVLYANSSKRRVASLAALLSSVLHVSIFSDKKMHFNSDESGPLKWFVECFLREGSKSPRSIRLAALHLSGLFYSSPHIIEFYVNELKLLTLYGTVAFDEDFESELIDNRDARTEVSLLAQSPEPELTHEFINTELFPRTCVAVLFHNLGKLWPLNSFDRIELSSAAFCGGKLFLMELLDAAVNDKNLAKELYKKYSAIHRRKIRVWQMICVLSNFVTDDIVCDVTKSLHLSLKRNNLPGVRQYLETFAINIYLKFPHLVKEQLIPIIQDYETRPQALSSYVFIAANVIIHSIQPLRLIHLDDLLPPIIPLLTSHHHSLRGFTQLLVYHVLVKFFPDLDSVEDEAISIERRTFQSLKFYLSKNPDCARLRRSMEGYLDNYDPYVSSTPSGIFINRVEDEDFECAPSSLMEEVLKFLNDARDDLRSSMANDLITINDESLSINQELKSSLEESGSLDFQKKITLCKYEMPLSECGQNLSFQRILEMEKEDLLLDGILQSRQLVKENLKAGRQQIIIVASLLDRIPNLAGLARTCEVFKASGLVVADKSILQDKQFQLISVTAEKWVPVIEVPVRSIRSFLEKKKCEGFSILGLEQTVNSVPVNKFVFPKKAVIVLGREKEGIPVDLIHILDNCIEIPQLGVVRSLNVHVSGAIALWEYTRQHIASD